MFFLFGIWYINRRRKKQREQAEKGGRSSGDGGSLTGKGLNLQESIKKKKDLSYYYAHERGNKASDVDITKIGKKGGYGIGAPKRLSGSNPAVDDSANSELSESGGGAKRISADDVDSTPQSPVVPVPLPKAITQYSWHDSGKFIKIYVDYPFGSAGIWTSQVQFTDKSATLQLESGGGAKYKLEVSEFCDGVKCCSSSHTTVAIYDRSCRLLLDIHDMPFANASFFFTFFFLEFWLVCSCPRCSAKCRKPLLRRARVARIAS